MQLDDQLKNLLRELGHAINDTVSESDRITGAIALTEAEVLRWLGHRIDRRSTLRWIADDRRVEALLEHIYRMQREEDDPELKVLIFTEFVPTQAMLAQHLRQRTAAARIPAAG